MQLIQNETGKERRVRTNRGAPLSLFFDYLESRQIR
jgi:hypothetical protein